MSLIATDTWISEGWVTDRVPLRLPLIEMYVPLKARIEVPKGETWARELKVAGRQASEAEMESMGERLSEPRAVLELLQKHDGLIILGDPGAGKTTFMKYIALHLALGQGEALGLKPRLPFLVPLSAYANVLANGEMPLDRFIADYYRERGVSHAIGPILEEALKHGGAWLLLDGLDEVRDAGQRRVVVDRVCDFFTAQRRRGNKFLLTSRIVGYKEIRPVVEGLGECTLVDFEKEETTLFVEKWTAALERAARGSTPVAAQEAAKEREELLTAVEHNAGVRRLASNPLLLMILALMKRQGVTLPERRAELYQNYIQTLLNQWNLVRGLGRPTTPALNVAKTVKVLAPLALWMHETSPGVGLVKQEELRRKLEAIFADRQESDSQQAADQFLADVRDHAGLLLERGAREYGFLHLTFQEYLAAVALAQQGQQGIEPVVRMLGEHLGDDSWHEVSLLTIGYLGIVQQREEAAAAVLLELVQSQPGEPGQAVILAGEAVHDVWPGGVTPKCRAAVIQALGQVMKNDQKVKSVKRAASGRVLAKLGDPRQEVVDLKKIEWRDIPQGPFRMGEEKKSFEYHIRYAYKMSRYPITNAQYQAFVEAGGYKTKDFWQEAKAAGVWSVGQVKGRFDDYPREGPYDRGEPFNLPNHPVVGVTWYEALAFTRWLTDRMHEGEVLPRDWEIRLPSEPEWEKAARGPESRKYPWGNEPDPNRANYDQTEIGTTSAVGCFPGGASPYGVKDMSGNVWEWTRSVYADYPYPEDEKGCQEREHLAASNDKSRVLRGGAFSYADFYLRCACRVNNAPDYRGHYIGFRVVASPFLL